MQLDRARLGPTLLALAAFIPLGFVLWWSLAGPRPEPPELDWAAFGFEVEEAGPGERPPFEPLHDPRWIRREMAGWQGELEGGLNEPLPLPDGRHAAVVRSGDGNALEPRSTIIGVVEWDPEAPDEAVRCAFGEPVALDDLIDDLPTDGDVRVEDTAIAGRCSEDGPLAAVPVVRRHTVPLGALERVLGVHAETALVPEAVIQLGPDGQAELRDEVDPSLELAVYPREVARGALTHVRADNPAAEVGTWAEPVYPVAAAVDGRIWWVLPVAPPEGAHATSGYLLTPADELSGDTLNPVVLHWLDEPDEGPDAVAERVHDLIDELDLADEEDANPAVRLTLPDRDDRWHGRVIAEGRSLRFRVEATPEQTCLLTPDGTELGCR